MNKEIDLESAEIHPNFDSEDADQFPQNENVDAEQAALESGVTSIEESTDGDEEDFLDEPSRTRSRKRRKLFCFNCNRPEGHFYFYQDRWYYSFLVGLTFGLIKILGPFQCQCCGSKRWMIANWLNPGFLEVQSRLNKKSSSSKRKKKKSRR